MGHRLQHFPDHKGVAAAEDGQLRFAVLVDGVAQAGGVAVGVDAATGAHLADIENRVARRGERIGFALREAKAPKESGKRLTVTDFGLDHCKGIGTESKRIDGVFLIRHGSPPLLALEERAG